MIFATEDFHKTCHELDIRNIPFEKVTLNRSGQKEKAIKLDSASWIMVKAGMVLTDN